MTHINFKIRLLGILSLFLFPLSLVARNDDKVDVKVVSEIQKNGVVGETFTHVVSLLSTSPEISDIRVAQAVKYPESIKVIKGMVRTGRPEQIKLNGKTYYRWTIRRDFLIPSAPGSYTIGKSSYVAFVPHVTGYYTDFWGRHQVVDYEEINVDCKAASFKVNKLPNNKTGKEFSGCVGEFNLDGWFPPGKIVAGKEAYVVFSISGFGSLQNLKLPNIYNIFGEGCKLKEVSQDESQSQRDGRLFSEVTLTCRFMPESEDFSIAPLCLLFYSPGQGKYVEKCSETLHWTSQPASKTESTSSKDAIEI